MGSQDPTDLAAANQQLQDEVDTAEQLENELYSAVARVLSTTTGEETTAKGRVLLSSRQEEEGEENTTKKRKISEGLGGIEGEGVYIEVVEVVEVEGSDTSSVTIADTAEERVGGHIHSLNSYVKHLSGRVNSIEYILRHEVWALAQSMENVQKLLVELVGKCGTTEVIEDYGQGGEFSGRRVGLEAYARKKEISPCSGAPAVKEVSARPGERPPREQYCE